MRFVLCSAAIVGLAAGCAGSTFSRQALAYSEADQDLAQRVCPMDVPNTTVFPLEVGDGAGLVFVTGDDVAALRARVRALAALQNRAAATGGAIASVEDVDYGAILTFTRGELGEMDKLQNDVVAYAEHLAGGDCPMTSDQTAVLPANKQTSVTPPETPPPASTVPGAQTGFNLSPILSLPPNVGFF